MSRDIPIALQEDLDDPSITMCQLLRVRDKHGNWYGFAHLDRDVTYDWGDGPLVHKARTGMKPASYEATADLAVDNSEAQTLIPTYDPPITPEMIQAGLFDYQTAEVVLVNYLAPENGAASLFTGYVGRVWIFDDLQIAFELRALSAYYREQGLCSLTSITCRHDFGSPQVDDNGRVGCGVDAEALWVGGEVTAVSLEPDRVFTVTLTEAPAYDLALGLIELIDGPNIGRQFEIAEVEDEGGNVFALTLNREAPLSFEVGQELRVRPDCPKTKEACIERANLINMGAEPHIVAGDAGKSSMPGARIGSGLVGGGSDAGTENEAV